VSESVSHDGAVEKELGRAVLNRRLELGYDSQAAAAAAANVGTTTWHLLETGKAIPKTPRVRRQIAKVLKWPEAALDRKGRSARPAAAEAELGPDEPVTRRYFDEQIAELRRAIEAAGPPGQARGRSGR
jgi:hypothetical protein